MLRSIFYLSDNSFGDLFHSFRLGCFEVEGVSEFNSDIEDRTDVPCKSSHFWKAGNLSAIMVDSLAYLLFITTLTIESLIKSRSIHMKSKGLTI